MPSEPLMIFTTATELQIETSLEISGNNESDSSDSIR